jgi:hypothetical protein
MFDIIRQSTRCTVKRHCYCFELRRRSASSSRRRIFCKSRRFNSRSIVAFRFRTLSSSSRYTSSNLRSAICLRSCHGYNVITAFVISLRRTFNGALTCRLASPIFVIYADAYLLHRKDFSTHRLQHDVAIAVAVTAAMLWSSGRRSASGGCRKQAFTLKTRI